MSILLTRFSSGCVKTSAPAVDRRFGVQKPYQCHAVDAPCVAQLMAGVKSTEYEDNRDSIGRFKACRDLRDSEGDSEPSNGLWLITNVPIPLNRGAQSEVTMRFLISTQPKSPNTQLQDSHGTTLFI